MLNSIVKIDLIKDFLNYYSIDYDLLSLDTQALIVFIANILCLITVFIALYILYRLLAKFGDMVLN